MKKITFQVWCLSSHGLTKPKNRKNQVLPNKFETREEAVEFINEQDLYHSYVILEVYGNELVMNV